MKINLKYSKNFRRNILVKREPKWGYIHTFFPTSHKNRERKYRYYIDKEDKFLKKPHSNKLRYKRIYK